LGDDKGLQALTRQWIRGGTLEGAADRLRETRQTSQDKRQFLYTKRFGGRPYFLADKWLWTKMVGGIDAEIYLKNDSQEKGRRKCPRVFEEHRGEGGGGVGGATRGEVFLHTVGAAARFGERRSRGTALSIPNQQLSLKVHGWRRGEGHERKLQHFRKCFDHIVEEREIK